MSQTLETSQEYTCLLIKADNSQDDIDKVDVPNRGHHSTNRYASCYRRTLYNQNDIDEYMTYMKTYIKPMKTYIKHMKHYIHIHENLYNTYESL